MNARPIWTQSGSGPKFILSRVDWALKSQGQARFRNKKWLIMPYLQDLVACLPVVVIWPWPRPGPFTIKRHVYIYVHICLYQRY